MPHRFWQFVCGVCLALTLAACTPAKPTFKGSDITGVDWGKDITLTSQSGKPLSTADFRGKVAIVFFGYSHCPDICSPTLAKLAAVRKALGPDAEKVQVIFVSVDPAYDTPEQLAAFLRQFDPTFVGLTGKLDDIAAAAKEYKIAFVPSSKDSPHPQIDHASSVLVKDSAGKLRLLWNGEMSVEDMAQDVRLLFRRGS